MAVEISVPNSQVLHSWKDISSYSGRGVRTLQRYESHFGFPIHRPLGKPRSSVLAFREEIDRWLAETPIAVTKPDSANSAPATHSSSKGAYNFVEDRRASSIREGLDTMVKNLYAMRKGIAATRLLAFQASRNREQSRILRQILRERSRVALKLANEILKSHCQISPGVSLCQIRLPVAEPHPQPRALNARSPAALQSTHADAFVQS